MNSIKKIICLSIAFFCLFHADAKCKRISKKKKQTSTLISDTTAAFIVSFISIGEGIDNLLLEKFEKRVNSNKPALNFTKLQKGREGEKIYCFFYSKNKSLTRFIEDTKKMCTNNKLVQITEKGQCK